MKAVLTRIRPDPMPAVQSVAEYRAGPGLTAIYDDTKAVFQVPWMGVVAQAFVHYPQFWKTLWAGMRPLAKSVEFENATKRLRIVAETGSAEMANPALAEKLESMGYAPGEIAEIRAVLDVFGRGNMPYLLLATMARMLLEGHDLSSNAKVEPTRFRQAPESEVPLVLMEPHHAGQDTTKLFDDIRKTLGLPFVNTDYRALARWPSYFKLAWGGLKPLIGSVDHMAAVETVHDQACALVAGLPNPGKLTPGALQAAAENDASLDEVLDVVQLFQWLLPELVVNIACLRAQLSE